MKLGLSLRGLSPRWYAECARAAEAAGFDSIWMQDHVVFPAVMPAEHPYGGGEAAIDPRTSLIDPWVALTTVANATERVRLATNVYLAALRSPFVTARAAVSLDRLSGGRLSLGVGVGWLRAEYEAIGVAWDGRGRRLDEILSLLRRLWSEERIEHAGEFYAFDAVCFEPKPRQTPSIPLLVGGESRPAMRRAAERGDGWVLAWLGPPDEVAAKLEAMRGLRRACGRLQAAFETSGSARTTASPHELRGYRDAGLDRVILDVAGVHSAAEVLEAIDRVREQWIEHL